MDEKSKAEAERVLDQKLREVMKQLIELRGEQEARRIFEECEKRAIKALEHGTN